MPVKHLMHAKLVENIKQMLMNIELKIRKTSFYIQKSVI